MLNSTVKLLSEIEYFALSLLPLIFCILSVIILCYYIRRRYLLQQDIAEFPDNEFITSSLINYRKNLKLMCTFTNFIIVILLIETFNNFSLAFESFQIWVIIPHFKYIYLNSNFFHFSQLMGYCVILTRNMFIPMLSLFLKVIWYAYIHHPYSYTISKWILYISIRVVVSLLLHFSCQHVSAYNAIIHGLYIFFTVCLCFIDFCQYLYSAKRFYSHLKSRECEAMLTQNMYLIRRIHLNRLHFKVATCLVSIALFLFSFSSILSCLKNILLTNAVHCDGLTLNCDFVDSFFCLPSLIFYKIIFIFDYSYFVFAMLYMFIRSGYSVYRINDRIRPLVKQYHYHVHMRIYVNR